MSFFVIYLSYFWYEKRLLKQFKLPRVSFHLQHHLCAAALRKQAQQWERLIDLFFRNCPFKVFKCLLQAVTSPFPFSHGAPAPRWKRAAGRAVGLLPWCLCKTVRPKLCLFYHLPFNVLQGSTVATVIPHLPAAGIRDCKCLCGCFTFSFKSNAVSRASTETCCLDFKGKCTSCWSNACVFVCLCVSVCVRQNHAASPLGSSILRCDKLEQAEIKSLLMCFLHVLKSMSEGNPSLMFSHIAELIKKNTQKKLTLLSPLSPLSPLSLFQTLCSPTGTRPRPPS